ncbi:pyridoxamine 5'-phosphate oxidase family protein [Ferviditalea candida]|uniref:Pyridoxamine 5'-phosphate oxidase family protein n=1 Tax=Ferviditalea candida TaxID=3108399 RepID=A0ABU5ZDS9_9BACL|nr:pyridoxamine 5'-phosphate oxidase family protein [Paenibacillaceae bacterium T2]
MSEIAHELSETILSRFQKQKFVLLNTVDAETGGPTGKAISWIYAVNSRLLRFAVDQRSRIVDNIKRTPKVAITLFASGTVYTVSGKASIFREVLEEVPISLTCIEVNIDTVKDAMFDGARISVEPEYENTYDKRAAEKLDNQVFAAMKKA